MYVSVCVGEVIAPIIEGTLTAPDYRQFAREFVCVLQIPNESASLGPKEERKGTGVDIGSQGHEFFLLGVLKDSSGLCWDGVSIDLLSLLFFLF
jgi:hypothetical protein